MCRDKDPRRAPEWLVVDHYDLDKRWESAMRSSVGRVMAIDDLANRPHDCDLLLDQNWSPNFKQDIPQKFRRDVALC